MFKHLSSEKPQASSAGHKTAGAINCGDDPIAALKTMFVDLVLGDRISKGQDPVLRPVFLKPHGIVRGTFTVRPDLPEDLRTGLFRGEIYPAWIRFSSDTLPTLPDQRSTLGIAIKLFGVPGEKLLQPETEATTHDFLLQNHDVFFVDTARDMCEFTYAGVVNGDYGPYLQAHPTTKRILDEMAKFVPSVLASNYWSVLPYTFGDGRYVKYKLSPAEGFSVEPLPCEIPDDPDYLHADLRRRLQEQEMRFDFLLQFRTDADHMPLDRATVRWEESESQPVAVATLTLPRQDIDGRGQATYGENLAYNPWHALPDHRPVGSIAEARKVVYAASAVMRRNANAVPLGEPVQPRPLENLPPGRDGHIVRAKIHPAIGIARIGNSESEEDSFIGPEVTEPSPLTAGSYTDSKGALKRQAARFRLYGYNAAGEVVAELTADNADIHWTVHIANKKAAWYQFQIALDIPEATAAEPSMRRNASIAGDDRKKLIIDPGPRTIGGRNKSGKAYQFNTGTFMDRAVYLGELRTDEMGRLLCLGGRGVSASYDGSKATTFANNDKWHDDVSDGPVSAEATINGRVIPVEAAWVVVAPPNYAPDVLGVRTLYDLLHDLYIREGWLPFPEKVSFARDVYPILSRLVGLEWVNYGFAVKFGWGRPEHFLQPDYLARLASTREEYKEVRRQVFTACRDFDRDGYSPLPWPWLYGDAMNIPPVKTPRQHSALTATQLRLLELWADGKFEEDFHPSVKPFSSLRDVPLAQQPDMVDRAALTFCLADAFHPGCEVTWPMRHSSLYAAPFRIRHRRPDESEPNYGSQLQPEIAIGLGGPLYAQGPGGLTRWMAVPWQTDTASCRSGYFVSYEPIYDPYVPTFWPARVPNHVLTLETYKKVIDENLPREERLIAYNQRAVWLRGVIGPSVPEDYIQTINNMVQDFGKLGVVETREGVPNDPDLPPTMRVESVPRLPAAPRLLGLMALHVDEPQVLQATDTRVPTAVEQTKLPSEQVVAGFIEKVRRFPRGLKAD